MGDNIVKIQKRANQAKYIKTTLTINKTKGIQSTSTKMTWHAIVRLKPYVQFILVWYYVWYVLLIAAFT